MIINSPPKKVFIFYNFTLLCLILQSFLSTKSEDFYPPLKHNISTSKTPSIKHLLLVRLNTLCFISTRFKHLLSNMAQFLDIKKDVLQKVASTYLYRTSFLIRLLLLLKRYKQFPYLLSVFAPLDLILQLFSKHKWLY